MSYSQIHWLCVCASGSLMTVICKFVASINVSCLHFGQNSGKFFSSVSSLILVRLLLPQTGQYIHSITKNPPDNFWYILRFRFFLPISVRKREISFSKFSTVWFFRAIPAQPNIFRQDIEGRFYVTIFASCGRKEILSL